MGITRVLRRLGGRIAKLARRGDAACEWQGRVDRVVGGLCHSSARAVLGQFVHLVLRLGLSALHHLGHDHG